MERGARVQGVRRWGAKPPPKRYLAPIGDGDLDRWMSEGLAAFGSRRRSVQAATLAGAALPLLFALFSLLYTWVNNLVAPPGEREIYTLAHLWELVRAFALPLVRGTLIFAAVGALFGVARRESVRLRLRLESAGATALSHLCDSRLAASVLGWCLYAGWALWPRSGQNFSGALQHTWLWVFFGILLSMYLHWAQRVILYRLYFRDWEGACTAVAARLIRGNLGLRSECRVEADADTGELRVFGFPRDQGVQRLGDLLRRIPGVRRLVIEEADAAGGPEREILTIHVPSERFGSTRSPWIILGDVAFAAGALSGPVVYLAGLVAIAARRQFFALSSSVVILAIQVEALALALGYVLRARLHRHALKDLPRQLERALNFAGKELKGFAYGDTWEEAKVVADLTRREAIEILAPVAARFGLRRLLVEAPIDRSPAPRVRRYGWGGA